MYNVAKVNITAQKTKIVEKFLISPVDSVSKMAYNEKNGPFYSDSDQVVQERTNYHEESRNFQYLVQL